MFRTWGDERSCEEAAEPSHSERRHGSQISGPRLATDGPERRVEVLCYLRQLVSSLDADALPGPLATELVGFFTVVVNLGQAGRMLAARAAASTDQHRQAGFPDPVSWLADRSGTSVKEAAAELRAAEAAADNPSFDAVLRSGELEPGRAETVAEAARENPACTEELLDSAQGDSRSELELKARRSKAAARAEEEAKRSVSQIHDKRFLRFFTDGAGGLNGRFLLEPVEGAKLRAVIDALAAQIFAEARRDGLREHPHAYAADALVELAELANRADESHPTARPDFAPPGHFAGGRATDREQPAAASSQQRTESNDAAATLGDVAAAERAGADGDSTAPVLRRGGRRGEVRAQIVLRVDAAALRRGSLEQGEVCEIPGVGPVPLATVEHLLGRSTVDVVVRDGVDVLSVTGVGRNIPRALELALIERDPCCVVPGCGRTRRLEIDHVLEYSKRGPTKYSNLARLCHFHHLLKTHRGYLLGGGPGAWTWRPPLPRHVAADAGDADAGDEAGSDFPGTG